MEKVIRDGMVAVIYSPGYGAGWYTWNEGYKELLFHPKIVEMIEAGKQELIDDDWVETELGIKGVYTGGSGTLTIKWLPEGTAFTVDEYDGSESIETIESLTIIA